jgi:hypothetical protein
VDAIELKEAQRHDEGGAMNDESNLAIHVRFDDLQLSIVHEGKAGDLALTQAVLLQIPDAWTELLASVYGASHKADT